jgi:hypothetical protein
VHIFLDRVPVTPPSGVTLRKAPGHVGYDFGHTICVGGGGGAWCVPSTARERPEVLERLMARCRQDSDPPALPRGLTLCVSLTGSLSLSVCLFLFLSRSLALSRARALSLARSLSLSLALSLARSLSRSLSSAAMRAYSVCIISLTGTHGDLYYVGLNAIEIYNEVLSYLALLVHKYKY